MSASYGPVKPYKPGPISQKVNGLLDYFGVGHYPKEYNPRVHGPYDPSRFYGKPDVNFWEVKLSELPAWLARRNKTPSAAVGVVSRGIWRWQLKWLQCKNAGLQAPIQVFVIALPWLLYLSFYPSYKKCRHAKYHW